MAASELERRSSELHFHLSSSTSIAAQEDPNVRNLPTLPSAVNSVKGALPPFQRKRSASGDGPSRAKKARSLSVDAMEITEGAMSSEEFDSDDSAFVTRSLSRHPKKSKPRLVMSSSDELSPHHIHPHQQRRPLPPEATSSSHSALETEEDVTTSLRECLSKHFSVPGM